MIVAVLGRHAGIALGQADVFVNVAGGVRIDEPGADLGVALAIASAARRTRSVPAPPASARSASPAVCGPLRRPSAASPSARSSGSPRPSCRTARPRMANFASRRRRRSGRRSRWPSMRTDPRKNRELLDALKPGRAGHAAARRDRRHHPRASRRAARHRRAVEPLVSLLGRHASRPAVHVAGPLRAGEDGRRDHRQLQPEPARLRERPADARPGDPVLRDGHAPPHGRARRQADGRARRLDLPAARDRDDLPRARSATSSARSRTSSPGRTRRSARSRRTGSASTRA